MRPVGNLWNAILDRENFRHAWHAAVRGKRDRGSVRIFNADVAGNLDRLREAVEAGQAPNGGYNSFVVHDPKRRTISAPSFEDRILHHAVIRQCEPVFEKSTYFDSYACRIGKGQVRALQRARQFSAAGGWFLKMDIRRYFDSIDHAVLLDLLASRFREAKLRGLFQRIVATFHPDSGCGLPIGSLTSQHFANFYLGQLDGFVKQGLRLSRYLRYMDDFVVWGETKEELLAAWAALETFLQEKLKLGLNPPTLGRVEQGVSFLGYRVFPHSMIVGNSGRRRLERRWRLLEHLVESGKISEGEGQSRANSLVAFTLAGGARTLAWRQQFAARHILGEEQRGPKPGDTGRCLEQRRVQLCSGLPQQERASQPQQQPWLPGFPQLQTEL